MSNRKNRLTTNEDDFINQDWMVQSEVTIGTDFRGNRSNIAGPSAELFSFTSNLRQHPKK